MEEYNHDKNFHLGSQEILGQGMLPLAPRTSRERQGCWKPRCRAANQSCKVLLGFGDGKGIAVNTGPGSFFLLVFLPAGRNRAEMRLHPGSLAKVKKMGLTCLIW